MGHKNMYAVLGSNGLKLVALLFSCCSRSGSMNTSIVPFIIEFFDSVRVCLILTRCVSKMKLNHVYGKAP
jgi:hypothetical protein